MVKLTQDLSSPCKVCRKPSINGQELCPWCRVGECRFLHECGTPKDLPLHYVREHGVYVR